MKISQARAYQNSGVSVMFYLHIFQHPLSQPLTNGMASAILSESRISPAVRPSRLSSGALTAMQRGRRCTLTTAPLQTNGGLTAEKRELFRTKSASKNQWFFPFWKRRKALPWVTDRKNAHITMGFSDAKVPETGHKSLRNELKRKFR